MTLLVDNSHDNAARASLARKSAELANAVTAYSLNFPLTAAGCATATVTSKAKTANTLTYTINGVFKSLVATDNFWTLGGATSATTVQVNCFQKYLLLVDGSGTATVQEGLQSVTSAATVLWTNVNSFGRFGPILSIWNAGKTVAGVLTIATDATHTFTPGTTLFGATGITATFIDGLDQSLLPLLGNETGLIIGAF